MKKYLGSVMTAYSAVIAPLFVMLPLLLAAVLLWTVEMSGATVFLISMACSCSVIWIIYIKKEILQLYAWGYFGETCVKIHCPFTREFALDYEKCRAVGIGYYTHGVLKSRLGTRIYFIYLSYDYFDAEYSDKINLWKPNTHGIKLQFHPKIYDYLLATLPEKQAKMLEQSYRNSSLGQRNKKRQR